MQTERKKRNSKKNKLEEIQKARGYERELPLDEIVGATDCKGDLMFLVKWLDCDEYDIISAKEVKERNPANVIEFYENRSNICKLAAKRAIIAEEYPLENLFQIAGGKPDHGIEQPNEIEIESEENNEVSIADVDADGVVGDSRGGVAVAGDISVADTSMTSFTDPSLSHSMSIAEPESANISLVTDCSTTMNEIPSAEPLVEPPESTDPIEPVESTEPAEPTETIEADDVPMDQTNSTTEEVAVEV